MNLTVQLYDAKCTNGVYIIHAQGFITASLYWSNGENILEDWTAFAHIPLDANGNGRLHWQGGQKIPLDASHMAAVLKRENESSQIIHTVLPLKYAEIAAKPSVRFTIMSDLHLSSRGGKLGRLQRALRLGKNSDCVLLVGDLTNDGTTEQLSQFMQHIEEELPNVPVLCVTGNHDYPRYPIPMILNNAINDYPDFQHHLIQRAQNMGVLCEETDCGAYRAWVNGIPVIGLNAISHFRRFVFERGEQLIHLEKWLSEESPSKRIILCHAPLLQHNPVRHSPVHPAYLSRDKQLQTSIDRLENVIFVSGHTHVSMNDATGCLDVDGSNLYINDSSITKTMFHTPEAIADAEWLDGAVLHMEYFDHHVQWTGQCISSKKYISRANYWI